MTRRRRYFSIGISALLVVSASVVWALSSTPYAPAQPIDFSHRDHVGEDKLACGLCHSGVRRAAFAGVPPVERCMGCHRFVLTANPGVAELSRYWYSQKPVP